MSPITIQNIECILTAPDGLRMVMVKVTTSEPGLVGYGCATFTQRAYAVKNAIEAYIRPFAIGRDVDRIDDLFQAAYVSSYWRQGPVLNNALSGLDQALWDIKGKRANMPVYQLVGGKVREAAPVYVHASDDEKEGLADKVLQYMDEGFRYVRCQMSTKGYSSYGARSDNNRTIALDIRQTRTWEPTPYVQQTTAMFEYLRNTVGEEVELLHDVHERIPAIQAVWLAKALEPYRLFFLEDIFSPEDIDYLRMVRQQTSTPMAIGELFSNVSEIVPLMRERLLDFVRCHISTIGGFTQARKIAAMAELLGIRTAWHGPGDVSWFGHAANLHLDLVSPNFGIQEFSLWMHSEKVREIFPVVPEIKDGALWATDLPGWGVEIDEKAAAKHALNQGDEEGNGAWPEVRRWDGTVIKP
ncbi:MAG: enolase C-terminal domain-like protein [Anaerolineae bacterium]|jgi:mannonate dehydratase|nr:enolase C-terminal domain-like protein [Anaerolineae bacterium]